MKMFTKKLLILMFACITVIGGGCGNDSLRIQALQHLDISHPIKNVLVLGNSITLHGKCSYWWGEWGMAASSREKDFVHVLQSKLNCQVDFMNYYQWEVMHNDRAETYSLIQDKLCGYPDVVILQLGENIQNIDTLPQDFCDLVKHIQKTTFNAKIIVVGNFWKNQRIDKIKQGICDGKDIAYVDLSDMQGSEYQAGLNSNIMGNDGQIHAIKHKGVAAHPGDKGMREIAEKIIRVIK